MVYFVNHDATILFRYPEAKPGQEYTVPSSVTEIDSKAFLGVSVLSSVILTDSINKINSYAFSEAPSLTSVIIPNSVTRIGAFAFSDSEALNIYAEASSKPGGWNILWNADNRPVIWDYQVD